MSQAALRDLPPAPVPRGAGCLGDPPLSPRLEGWHLEVGARPRQAAELLRRHGSPLHLHHVEPLLRNAADLRRAAEEAGVHLGVFFARKANKAVAYVEAARDGGLGIDVASERELRQCLDGGVRPRALISTAAVKTSSLLALCAWHGIVTVLDNDDELEKLEAGARRVETPAPVALRLSGFRAGSRRLGSRFGWDVADFGAVVERLRRASPWLWLEGLHFHLDGYDAADRVAALDTCLELADELAALEMPPCFIDMGGGVPVSYLAEEEEWRAFLAELDRALRGERPPITYGNHGFGRLAHESGLVGEPAVYPHFQRPVGAAWLGEVLEAPRPSDPSTSIAEALRSRNLELRCEPGRSLVDGCGLTLARVEHRKRLPDGDWFIGLLMNGSQCRSRKSELLVDPLLLPASDRPRRGDPMEGYLTGAYCSEDDLITHRKLCFPDGVEIGDVLAFPNTAGYLMHFVESRSHGFPLPKNLVVDGSGNPLRLDPADQAASGDPGPQLRASSRNFPSASRKPSM